MASPCSRCMIVPAGRPCLRGRRRRVLHAGWNPAADVTASRGAQAGECFNHATGFAAARHGVSNVIRTWFYLDNILGWYAEFNRVRTGFFEKANLGIMPASTGWAPPISMARPLWPRPWPSFKDAGPPHSEGESPLQCEAFSYGSAFSRAVELCDAASRTLYISGTASIEPGGRTIHHGNTARQSRPRWRL